MKIIRVLVYEGDETSIMSGLAARAVQGERTLGNGVKCREAFFAYRYEELSTLDTLGDEALVSSVETEELREQIAALPRPSWASGKESGL